jgi:hypothetical protein
MPPALVCRLIATAVIVLSAAMPAAAEIEKFMQHCDGKLCAFFRVSIAVPDGWVEDREATDYFKVQMLLPKNVEFDKAPAKICVMARYNPKRQPISDFLPDTIKDWRGRAKDAKITKLEDLARGNGKAAFVRNQFEARSQTATKTATNLSSPLRCRPIRVTR